MDLVQYGTHAQKNIQEAFNRHLNKAFAYHVFKFCMFDAREYCVSCIGIFHCDLELFQFGRKVKLNMIG